MIPGDPIAGLLLLAGTGFLLVLALLKSSGARHERVACEGGTAFLGERIMHLAYGWIDALAVHLAKTGVKADTVTWTSVLLGAVAGFGVASGRSGLAAWALALSGLCDGLDGAIARKQGSASRRGAVLDSTLDRYVEFFVFAGLLFYFRGEPLAQLVMVTALFGSMMVTYSTAKAEALQVKPPRGWMKRAERMVWLTGGCALAAASGLFAHGFERWILLFICAVIALFANLSAMMRVRTLCRSV